MSWVLLDDDFPNNPKVLKARRFAAYTFVCGLCYCRKYHTGGYIPMEALDQIGASATVIEALIGAGLWTRHDGGMKIHGYDGLYADEDAKEKKDAKAKPITPELSLVRSQSGRQGGLQSGVIRGSKRSKFASISEAKEGTDRISTSDLLLEEKKREADFGVFWATYPRKDGKRVALAEWCKLKPLDDVQKVIAADLERRKRSPSWQKDGGQFVPHAKTYLHQRRWEDGFEEPLMQAVGGRTGAPPKGKYDGIEES